MFQGLFRRAETTIDNAVAKLTSRAAVAVPLVIAVGFASAAVTVWLVDRFGSITAYAMMAALFSLVSLITMAIVSTNGAVPVEAAAPSAASSAPNEASGEKSEDGNMDPFELLTPELRAMLASAAPMALPAVVRGVGRNLPLIFVLALVGFVISRFAASSDTADEAASGPAGEDAQPDLATSAAEAAA